MLKNYLTLAIRTIVQRLQFSLINMAGLSVGMAACFVLVQFARYETSYDAFHPNAENIFRLALKITTDQGSVTEVPKNFSALGPALQRELSEVKDFVRVFPIDGSIAMRSGTTAFNEKQVIFADASLFSVFNFPMIHGDPGTALEKPASVVLTRTTAKRYFGQEEVVGKQITMREGQLDVTMVVTGVIDDVPENSHLPFDLVVSHATLKQLWGERAENSWDEALFYTYVYTQPGGRTSLLRKLTPELLTKFTGWKQSAKIEFVVQPLRDIYLTSHMVQEARVNGNDEQVRMLWIIAAMVVMLSWINYVNLSTARYLERAKEVSVRKIIGASRVQLVVQFVSESIVIMFVSMVVAALIVQMVSPLIASLTGKSIPLWNDHLVLAALFAVFLTGSLVAAIFPALILSSLKIPAIIKGAFKASSSGQWIRQGLIVVQFMTSAVIVGGTYIAYQQIRFMRTAELGTDVATTIVLPSPDITDSTYSSRAVAFKSELSGRPGVRWVVSSSSIPGKQDNIVQGGLIRFENGNGEGAMHYAFDIDRNYIPAFNLKLIAGRNFAETGDHSSVVINETAMRKLGFATPDEAVGHDIAANWTPKATVIGVVADFHQHSLKSPIEPVVFRLDERGSFGYFSIRIDPSVSSVEKCLAEVRAEWDREFPQNPFDYFFLDRYYEQQYQDDIRFGNVLMVFSGLGLFIACLGIFGLAVFNAAKRTKEISIRKVLGASVARILVALSIDYLLLITVALLIAAPITYSLSVNWLSKFAFHISVMWWMLLLPALLIVLVAVTTVSALSFTAATSNPTKHLNS